MSYDEIRRMSEAFRSMREQINGHSDVLRALYDQDLYRNVSASEQISRALKDLTLDKSFYGPASNSIAKQMQRSLEDADLHPRTAHLNEAIQKAASFSTFSQATESAARIQNLLNVHVENRTVLDNVKDSFNRMLEIRNSLPTLAADFGVSTPILPDYYRWIHAAPFRLPPNNFRELMSGAESLSARLADLYSALPAYETEEEEEEEDSAEHAVEVAREQLADSLAEKNPLRLLESIDKLLSGIREGAVKLTPITKKFLYDILTNVLAGLIAAGLLMAAQDCRGPKTDKRILTAIKKAETKIPRFSGHIYAVIARDYLIVRQGPGKKHSVVGRLYPGEIVNVLKKRSRSWVLIEFQDPSGDVVVRGWVYNRYLKRLRGCVEEVCTPKSPHSEE